MSRQLDLGVLAPSARQAMAAREAKRGLRGRNRAVAGDLFDQPARDPRQTDIEDFTREDAR